MENNFFKKHNKKVIIGLVFAGIFSLLLYSYFNNNNSHETISSAEVTTLTKTGFLNSVNESGNAVSKTNRNVYAEKILPIKTVNVEVGDKVEVGDIIATLDDSTILQQLEQKRAMITTSDRSSSAQINSAQDTLNQARRNLREGTNPQIISAESAVTSAYDAWQSALLNVESISSQNSSLNSNNTTIEKTESPIDTKFQNSFNNLTENIIKNTEKVNLLNEDLLSLSGEEIELNQKLLSVHNELNNIVSLIQDSNVKLNLENLITKINNFIRTKSTANSIINDINNFKSQLISYNENNRGEIESYLSQIAILIEQFKDNIDLSNFKKEKIANVENIIEKNKEALEALKSEDPNKIQVDISINPGIPQEIPGDLQNQGTEDVLKTARKTANDLKNQYDAALKNLEVAKIMARDEITALENNLNVASASADNTINYVDIEYLNEELEKTTVYSPIAGTITDVNMIIGQNPQDFLAKIETIETLVVESQVKEFDVNSIRPGMEVEISNDASENDKITKGKVESISPTPTQTQIQIQGSTSNEVTYDVLIYLNENSDEIKPGMNVRVRYILDRKDDVFVVPTTSIYRKGDKFFVLAMDERNGSEVYEMEVEISSENDFETVISSENLKDGLFVLNSPDLYSPGTTLQVVDTLD